MEDSNQAASSDAQATDANLSLLVSLSTEFLTRLHQIEAEVGGLKTANTDLSLEIDGLKTANTGLSLVIEELKTSKSEMEDNLSREIEELKTSKSVMEDNLSREIEALKDSHANLHTEVMVLQGMNIDLNPIFFTHVKNLANQIGLFLSRAQPKVNSSAHISLTYAFRRIRDVDQCTGIADFGRLFKRLNYQRNGLIHYPNLKSLGAAVHEALGAMTRREDSITSAGDNLLTFSVTVIREYDPRILNLIKLYGKPDRSLDASVVINAAEVSNESVGGSPVLPALGENSSLDREAGWKLVCSRKKFANTEKDRINLSLKRRPKISYST